MEDTGYPDRPVPPPVIIGFWDPVAARVEFVAVEVFWGWPVGIPCWPEVNPVEDQVSRDSLEEIDSEAEMM